MGISVKLEGLGAVHSLIPSLFGWGRSNQWSKMLPWNLGQGNSSCDAGVSGASMHKYSNKLQPPGNTSKFT